MQSLQSIRDLLFTTSPASLASIVICVILPFIIFTCTVKYKRKATPKLHPQLKTPTDLQINVNDAPLCSTCAHLDLHQILLHDIPREKSIPLGSLPSIFQKSPSCAFCRLVSSLIRRTWLLHKFPHLDLSSIQCSLFSLDCGSLQEPPNTTTTTTSEPDPSKLCHRITIDTSDRPREIYPSLIASQSGLSLEIQLMDQDAPKFNRPTDLHGRIVHDTFDLDLLKNWITLCEDAHGDLCESVWWIGNDHGLPGFIRMVDVQSMAVVPAPPACRYVALSYLWGGIGAEYWTTTDNIHHRSKLGGLDTANFPDTITDSISLVRQLGQRYLWIDTLCIIQDDSNDKINQIHAMDLIYGASYFTIYAAGGTSARDPLPGYRPGTRTIQQHIEVIQGLHLSVPLPAPIEALTLSAWSTRGWTYQELMLSRRRIYFTGQQVYFECRRDIFCEDLVAESKRLPSSTQPLRYKGAGNFTYLRKPSHIFMDQYIGSYMSAIGVYTRRNLTMESDIVDAITAMTNALAKGFELGGGDPNRAFHFGMTLTDLDHALLWQHDPYTPRARRSLPDDGRSSSAWPSWAWATWRGAVQYEGNAQYAWIHSHSDRPRVAETLIDPVYIVDGNRDTVKIDIRRTGRAFVHLQPGAEMPPSYSPPRGMWDPTMEVRRPLNPGTLIFRTSCSRFSIARRVRGGEDEDKEEEGLHHGLFDIVSGTTCASWPCARVGSVILALEPTPPDSLDFIVVTRSSASAGVYDEERVGKPYHGCMLHVMAVSRNEGLMERIGLGLVHEGAWISSGAEERVVFLR